MIKDELIAWAVEGFRRTTLFIDESHLILHMSEMGEIVSRQLALGGGGGPGSNGGRRMGRKPLESTGVGGCGVSP